MMKCANFGIIFNLVRAKHKKHFSVSFVSQFH
jgi:hypothetical protein